VTTHFARLNDGWNAEPNAPDPEVSLLGTEVRLDFTANSAQFPRFADGQRLRLRFRAAARYRLGATNDEGWYRGQCRFSGLAPAWGDFYEVSGDLRLEAGPQDWILVPGGSVGGLHHFLFYLRDHTFECSARDWALEELPEGSSP